MKLTSYQKRVVERLKDAHWALITHAPLGTGTFGAMLQAAADVVGKDSKKLIVVCAAPLYLQHSVDEIDRTLGAVKNVIPCTPFYMKRKIMEHVEEGGSDDVAVVIDYLSANGPQTRDKISEVLSVYAPDYYWWRPMETGSNGAGLRLAKFARESAAAKQMQIIDCSGYTGLEGTVGA